MSDERLDTKLQITESFQSEYLDFWRMMPVEIVDGHLVVAVAGDPGVEAMLDLERSYGLPVRLLPVPLDALRDAIRRTYNASESMVELVRDLDAGGDHAADTPESLTDVRDLANQPPVIRYVNLLLRDAHAQRASDIHLEATGSGLRVRFRIDGRLTEMPSPPRALEAAIVSRIKLIASMDIADRLRPHDGRVRVRLDARDLDLRVSTTPVAHGESVVLRLLDRGGRPVQLDELGMPPPILEQFSRMAQRPHGIVLVTGPTGSGKTTTLYAALGLRRTTEEKIITLEDPIEYHLAGVTQVPVQAKAGMSFAAALRSILRQDPDVLLIGETRDAETAAIAIQAAMTGHLVFTTLHTNDAVSALTRLADLGVELYLIAATVEAMLAQRLVRRSCSHCLERYDPDPSTLAWLAGAPQPVGRTGRVFERGRGCDACRGTGYLGRIGIFELLVMTDEIRHALSRECDVQRLRQLAREEGLLTLREDGWRKVQTGLTTVEEVARVVS